MNAHTGEIILLVEDNPNDAKLAIRVLKQGHIGNTIEHLKDGEEALAYIFATGAYSSRHGKDLPGLILLDIMMPKINGIELLRILKVDERTKHIPVIAFVSSEEDPDVQVCFDLGVSGHIVKPLEFDKFSKAVKDIGLDRFLINQSPE